MPNACHFWLPPSFRRVVLPYPSVTRVDRSTAIAHDAAEKGPTLSAMDTMTPPQAHLSLLGGFRLRVEGTTISLPHNAQRLFAFLALYDRPLQRSFVSGSLWGDSTEQHAAGSLRSALWRLKGPTAQLIEHTVDHIGLSLSVIVDVRSGEALAHRVLDPAQDVDDFGDQYDRLLSLDLLPDWTEDWIIMERESYRQLRLRALESLCHRFSDKGLFGRAVQVGLAAVAGEPLRESARRALIQAHLGEHNVASAKREYDAYRTLLQEELDLEPSEDLLDLVRSPSTEIRADAGA